jgi:hypothetical protein
MNAPHIAGRPMPRRSFLRGAGVTLALPMLDCMTPIFAQAAAPPAADADHRQQSRRAAQVFFPQAAGKDYNCRPISLLLANSAISRSSGSRTEYAGGHSADNCLLTAARGAKSGFRNSISLDQFAAEKLGQVTRFRR